MTKEHLQDKESLTNTLGRTVEYKRNPPGMPWIWLVNTITATETLEKAALTLGECQRNTCVTLKEPQRKT